MKKKHASTKGYKGLGGEIADIMPVKLPKSMTNVL